MFPAIDKRYIPLMVKTMSANISQYNGSHRYYRSWFICICLQAVSWRFLSSPRKSYHNIKDVLRKSICVGTDSLKKSQTVIHSTNKYSLRTQLLTLVIADTMNLSCMLVIWAKGVSHLVYEQRKGGSIWTTTNWWRSYQQWPRKPSATALIYVTENEIRSAWNTAVIITLLCCLHTPGYLVQWAC